MTYEVNKTISITATELKLSLGKYIDYVSEGHQVIITKNGNNTAKLAPYISEYEQYWRVGESLPEYDKRQLTYEEFMAISDTTNARLEYIGGRIYVLESPSVSHQKIVGKLLLLLNEYTSGKSCEALVAPFDVHCKSDHLDQPEVVQPDLLVACDLEEDGVITDNDRYMGTPTLVVEILSKSTRSKDMVDKLNTYMLGGIKEYWIVDDKNTQIMVYTFDEYEIDQVNTYRLDEMVESKVFEGLACDVMTIFGRA